MSRESTTAPGGGAPIPPAHLRAVIRRAFALGSAQLAVAFAGVPLGPIFIAVPFTEGLFEESLSQALAFLIFGLFLTVVATAFLVLLGAERRGRRRLRNAIRAMDANVVSWQWSIELVDSGEETGNIPLGEHLVLTATWRDGVSQSVTLTRLGDAALLLRHISREYPRAQLRPQEATPAVPTIEQPPLHVLPALVELDEPVEHPAILGPFVLLGGAGLVGSLLLMQATAHDLLAGTASFESVSITVWLALTSVAILRAGVVAAGTSILGASRAAGAALLSKATWHRGLAVLGHALASSVRVIAAGAGIAAVLTLLASLQGVTLSAQTGAARVWVEPDGIAVAALMAGVSFLLWRLADQRLASAGRLLHGGAARALVLGTTALLALGVAGYGVKRFLWYGDELRWAVATDNPAVVRSWLARADDPRHTATELLILAIVYDSAEVAATLLEAGAVTSPLPPDRPEAGFEPESALFTVCSQGGPRVLRLLLERGADPNARGIGGRTPLHALLAREGLDREKLRTDVTQLEPMLELLLKHGADPALRPRPRDVASLSPIEEAAHTGLEAVVRRMRARAPPEPQPDAGNAEPGASVDAR